MIAILIAVLLVPTFFVDSYNPQRPEPAAYERTQYSSDHKQNAGNTTTGYLQRYADYCNDETNKKENHWFHYTACEKSSEVIIALFTLVLAIATICLIIVGVRQEIHLRDTARKELRAYLGIPDPIVQRLGDGNHFQVHATVTNTGRTPALKVRRWMLAKLVNKDEPIVFTEHELHPANRPIPPDAKWHLRQDFTEWSDDDINAITRYDKILWVWGQLSYQDIYGKPHTTDFRLRSLAHRFTIMERDTGTPKRFIMTDGWTLEPDAEGNDLN